MKNIQRNRNQNGWYIPSTINVARRKFYDEEFGGSEHSYVAASNEFDNILRKVETHTRSNKKSLGIVGITYYKIRDGRQTKHRFAVCNPVTGKPQMVHIGNDNTYEKNWERKLEQAIELREKFMTEHHDKHSQ